jgi:hypothetical protein
MTKHGLPVILIVLGFSFAGVAAAAQFYKWVDKNGVTHYSTARPKNQSFQVVDGRPAGYVDVIGGPKECYTVRCQYDRVRAEWVQDQGLRLAMQQASAAQRSSTTPARGMSLDTFRRLSVDTSEGEVLSRAGPPDYDSNQFLSSGFLGKTWYYFPTPGEPFLTVIEIQGGTVFSLNRTRQF